MILTPSSRESDFDHLFSERKCIPASKKAVGKCSYAPNNFPNPPRMDHLNRKKAYLTSKSEIQYLKNLEHMDPAEKIAWVFFEKIYNPWN